MSYVVLKWQAVKYQIYNYIDKKVQPRETLQYSNYTNQSHNFQNRAYGLYQSEQNEHNRSDSSSSPQKIGEVNPFQVRLTGYHGSKDYHNIFQILDDVILMSGRSDRNLLAECIKHLRYSCSFAHIIGCNPCFNKPIYIFFGVDRHIH